MSLSSKHFDARKDALQWGKQVSRNQGTELVVHWQARPLDERLADLDRNPGGKQT